MTVDSFIRRLCMKNHISLYREGDMADLALTGYDRLTIHWFAKGLVSFGHSFDENIKLIQNPEFLFHVEGSIWTPVSLHRGREVVEAAELDDDDRVIRVDSESGRLLTKEANRFVRELVAAGWLEKANVRVAFPRGTTLLSVN